MGLFNKLRRSKPSNYTPDFSLPEYDNWLNFVDAGGTSEQWSSLKEKSTWNFPKSEIETSMEYEKEIRPTFNKYLNLTNYIEKQWSILYHSKNYHCPLADEIEKCCHEAIFYYEKIRNIDLKYGKEPMTGSKVFTKLALLYERQGEYEKSIDACKLACKLGVDQTDRMKKMIKKAGREPTAEEMALMDD